MIGLLLVSLAGAVDDAVELDPASLAGQVDSARIELDLQVLTGHAPTSSGDIIESRYVGHPDIDIAGQWIVEAFGEIGGLTVQTESFSTGRGECFNVWADLPADDPAAPWVILGAHYDSTASADPEWDPSTDPAPGADDDGSGVVAVLEAARLVSAWRGGYEYNVRFVAFSAEEIGLVGSGFHVEQIVSRGEDVAMMLQLDPVGFNSTGSYIAAFEAEMETFATDLVATGDDIDLPYEIWTLNTDGVPDEYSDHFPFWQAGFPAIHLFGVSDQDLNHTMGDDLDIVDIDYTAAAAGLAASYIADLAGPLAAAAVDTGSDTGSEDAKGGCACGRSGTSGLVWLFGALALVWARRVAGSTGKGRVGP